MISNSLDFISKKIAKPLHRVTVLGKRVERLSHWLSQFFQQDEFLKGLDVGCGSGEIAKNIQKLCPHIEFYGVDILARKDTVMNIIIFDGHRLPFKDKSLDFTILVDVLHHTDDPVIIMKECVRVSRKFILLKDHICESLWDRIRLSFMDWLHNSGYAVYLPYNFLSKEDWIQLYKESKVVCETKVDKLNLYSQPFSYIFDSTLHFVARLAISENRKKLI